MNEKSARIVIIGGGFAGYNLVSSLLKEDGHIQVTLVDKNN
jgi:NADH dehydrogenase FAD-containing subunit